MAGLGPWRYTALPDIEVELAKLVSAAEEEEMELAAGSRGWRAVTDTHTHTGQHPHSCLHMDLNRAD